MKKHWKVFWIGIAVSFGFVGLIGLLGYRFDSVVLLPDQGHPGIIGSCRSGSFGLC